MEYAMVRAEGINLGWIRLGGPGLANLLWLWSKMIVFSKLTAAQKVWPRWRQLKPKALLRGEFSMAYYPEFFFMTQDYVRGVPSCGSLGRKSGDEVLGNMSLYKPTSNAIYEFSDIGSPFLSHFEYSDIIRLKLNEMAPLPFSAAKSKNNKNISVHVRRGDFRLLNLCTDFDLYWNAVSDLHSALDDNYIFTVHTDAVRGDTAFWDSIPKFCHVSSVNSAWEELCLMLQASIFIGTPRSSFSRLVSYVGGMPTLWCGDISTETISLTEMVNSYSTTEALISYIK